MTAPPIIEIYTGDLAASTAGMTAEVFGAYMRLLFYQWERGYIPTNIKELKAVCGVNGNKKWEQIWSQISSRFKAVDEFGRLGHPRIARDRPTAIEKWERQKHDVAVSRSIANEVIDPSDWPYKSKEFVAAWKLYRNHCCFVGGVTPMKLDADLLEVFRLRDESKAIRWLEFSVQVSKTGVLCDPDRFGGVKSEADEAKRIRKQKHYDAVQEIRDKREAKKQHDELEAGLLPFRRVE